MTTTTYPRVPGDTTGGITTEVGDGGVNPQYMDMRMRNYYNYYNGAPGINIPLPRNLGDFLPPFVYGITNNVQPSVASDPARAKLYDPTRDAYYMYNVPLGTVDRSFWRFFRPNFWFSRIVRSREHHCRKCCSYRDYWWSSKYKDDSRFDNFQCVKSNCNTLPTAKACETNMPYMYNIAPPIQQQQATMV